MISERRGETVERWLAHRRDGTRFVLQYAGAANRHERGREQRIARLPSGRRALYQRAARVLPNACTGDCRGTRTRSEEHTSELQSLAYLVCRLLLEKKKTSSRIETEVT